MTGGIRYNARRKAAIGTLKNYPLKSRGFNPPNPNEFKNYWDCKFWTETHWMAIFVLHDYFKIYVDELPEQTHNHVMFLKIDIVSADRLKEQIQDAINTVNNIFKTNFKWTQRQR